MTDQQWNHVRIVAGLNVMLGTMHLLILAMVSLNLSRGNSIGSDTLTYSLIAAMSVLSVPYIVIGLGLFFRKRWARSVARFIDPILLLEFPAGTPLGLYAIWLFWFRDTDAIFAQKPKLKVLK